MAAEGRATEQHAPDASGYQCAATLGLAPGGVLTSGEGTGPASIQVVYQPHAQCIHTDGNHVTMRKSSAPP